MDKTNELINILKKNIRKPQLSQLSQLSDDQLINLLPYNNNNIII